MSASTGQAPIYQRFRVRVPAVATAGNDSEVAVGMAVDTGHIVSVTYLPDGTQAGAATNNRSLIVLNKTATKTPAELDMSANDAAHNLTAFAAKTLPLSATATDYDVTAGDVLSFKSLHVGTGIADPGGCLEVVLVKD